ncbi:MAG: hypothetical protein V7642_666, partial [Burkholderiales bacterium]
KRMCTSFHENHQASLDGIRLNDRCITRVNAELRL